METLNQQLDKHGRPGAIYSDKHSILSGGLSTSEGLPMSSPLSGGLSTQFPPDKGGQGGLGKTNIDSYTVSKAGIQSCRRSCESRNRVK